MDYTSPKGVSRKSRALRQRENSWLELYKLSFYTHEVRKRKHCIVDGSPRSSLFAHLGAERRVELLNDILQACLEFLTDLALLVNGLTNLGVVSLEVGKEVSLPGEDLVYGDGIEVTVNTGEDQGDHIADSHGGVLLLLEQLSQTLTAVESLLGRSIEIGTELGESSDLTVLGQEKLQGTSDLLHGLDLGSGTDTGHGETDVDGRADTLVEQFGLQENLAVGDGDDVGGDVGRHITTLGLDNGQGSKRTTAVLVVHLGSTLKETRVEVEDTG